LYVTSEGGGLGCSLCGKKFTEMKNCRRHIREKHMGLGRDFCPYCNKEVNKRYIKDHIVTCKLAYSSY